MTVGEMVKSLRTPATIELRDEENYNICIVQSDGEGIELFKNNEIVDWLPTKERYLGAAASDLVFCIKEKDKEEKKPTYGDIYEEFCNKFPNAGTDDYRPAAPLYVDELNTSIPNAIVVWLKDGSKIIYVSEVKG